MTKLLGVPELYVQGPGIMDRLHDDSARFGARVLVVADGQTIAMVKGQLARIFKGTESTVRYEAFEGMCTEAEIDRLAKRVSSDACDVILGIGGGRALDSARAVAAVHQLPLIAVPATAASGAACGGTSVITDKNGIFREMRQVGVPATAVVVDSSLIAQAPVRSLVAGMGNTVAGWLGARAHRQSDAASLSGSKGTLSSYALARLGYDTILADGLRALVAAQNGMPTPAFEHVLEANIYCSGIAFDNSGIAAAHSIGNALTLLPPARKQYSGELAAFGCVVQLILENAPRSEMDDVMNLFLSTGLPMTLDDLGLGNASRTSLEKVAAAACDGFMAAMPFDVSADDVLGAILAASVTGHLYQEEEGDGDHDHEGD